MTQPLGGAPRRLRPLNSSICLLPPTPRLLQLTESDMTPHFAALLRAAPPTAPRTRARNGASQPSGVGAGAGASICSCLDEA